jgi:hypothetical protein
VRRARQIVGAPAGPAEVKGPGCVRLGGGRAAEQPVRRGAVEQCHEVRTGVVHGQRDRRILERWVQLPERKAGRGAIGQGQRAEVGSSGGFERSDNVASRATMQSSGLTFARAFMTSEPYLDPIPGAERGEVEYELTRVAVEPAGRSAATEA